MSTRFDDHRPTELEDKAHAEAVRHFAEQLKQFPASRSTIDRLERDIAKIGLAANMAAAKPTPIRNAIHADDGTQWQKSVELMENIFLCHRPTTGGADYAVVEHFPAQDTNEIWNRGGNAVEVLRMFAREQRQALQVWTEDMNAQVKEFLAERFPGQDMSRVADSFMHRLTRPVSQQQSQSDEQKIIAV
jgi:hypothetical protein